MATIQRSALAFLELFFGCIMDNSSKVDLSLNREIYQDQDLLQHEF